MASTGIRLAGRSRLGEKWGSRGGRHAPARGVGLSSVLAATSDERIRPSASRRGQTRRSLDCRARESCKLHSSGPKLCLPARLWLASRGFGVEFARFALPGPNNPRAANWAFCMQNAALAAAAANSQNAIGSQMKLRIQSESKQLLLDCLHTNGDYEDSKLRLCNAGAQIAQLGCCLATARFSALGRKK